MATKRDCATLPPRVTVQAVLPAPLYALVEREAQRTGESVSAVVKQCVTRTLDRPNGGLKTDHATP